MARTKRQSPRWVQTPAYWAIRAVLSAFLVGPMDLNTRRAASLAHAFARAPFNRKRLGRAVENLSLAFPHWPEEERLRHAVLSYEHLFKLAVETAYAPRLLTEDSWGDHVVVGDISAGVRHLLKGGPTILITGHCGNWEVLGYTLALLGFSINALYRPLDLRPLDQWVRQTRNRRGMHLVDKFGAAQEVPRLLSAGESVGFVADQNAGDRGLFVPYFGRLASSYKAISLFAMRYEAPLICGQARRLVWGLDHDGAEGVIGSPDWRPGAFRACVDVVDALTPDEWVGQPDPAFFITAWYRRAIEKMVRRAPEQYLWMHRYWKSRPRHERLGQPFPAALKDKLRTLPWMTEEELAGIVERSDRDAAEVRRSSGGAPSGEPEEAGVRIEHTEPGAPRPRAEV